MGRRDKPHLIKQAAPLSLNFSYTSVSQQKLSKVRSGSTQRRVPSPSGPRCVLVYAGTGHFGVKAGARTQRVNCQH